MLRFSHKPETQVSIVASRFKDCKIPDSVPEAGFIIQVILAMTLSQEKFLCQCIQRKSCFL